MLKGIISYQEEMTPIITTFELSKNNSTCQYIQFFTMRKHLVFHKVSQEMWFYMSPFKQKKSVNKIQTAVKLQ